MRVCFGHDGESVPKMLMMVEFVKLMLLAGQPNKSSSSVYSPKPKSHRSSSSTGCIPGAVLVGGVGEPSPCASGSACAGSVISDDRLLPLSCWFYQREPFGTAMATGWFRAGCVEDVIA
jgi:hypothetical protein